MRQRIITSLPKLQKRIKMEVTACSFLAEVMYHQSDRPKDKLKHLKLMNNKNKRIRQKWMQVQTVNHWTDYSIL